MRGGYRSAVVDIGEAVKLGATSKQSADIKKAVVSHARDIGFQAVGIASAVCGPEQAIDLDKFLAMGRHGEMDWLARRNEQRGSPQALWPEARSIIACGLSYAPGNDPREVLAASDRAAISVYAQGRDYHDVVKKKLKALARWMAETYDCDVKIFVDTAPVMEKPAAARAGLGWQGKHTNLVSRSHGSWLFLGEIFTTLDLLPDSPGVDLCGTCDACRRACPTDALPEPGRIDPTRCISYLTIEHKGPIAESLAERMGNRVYGCDDCLAACPWNKFAPPIAEPALMPRVELTRARLADLAELDETGFRNFFAGSPIKRTGRDRFLRNVAIAIGNSGDNSLLPTARQLAGDECTLVAEPAARAVERLQAIPRKET